jgi:tetratricopeptide (TPR) repeat protein
MTKPPSRENRAEEVRLFDRALTLDPRSAEAKNRLAIALAARVLDGLTDTAAADVGRAEHLAGQALAEAPHDPLSHHARAQVLRAQRRYAEAISECETVLASNPNSVAILMALSQCKLFTGSMDETIPLMERAIRLSPRDPLISICYLQIGLVHLLLSRTDEAILWLEKARPANPARPVIPAWLASAYALKGETERAAVELAEARRLSPDDRYSSLARLRAFLSVGVAPKIRALFEATFFAGLRKAGMPEE